MDKACLKRFGFLAFACLLALFIANCGDDGQAGFNGGMAPPPNNNPAPPGNGGDNTGTIPTGNFKKHSD